MYRTAKIIAYSLVLLYAIYLHQPSFQWVQDFVNDLSVSTKPKVHQNVPQNKPQTQTPRTNTSNYWDKENVARRERQYKIDQENRKAQTITSNADNNSRSVNPNEGLNNTKNERQPPVESQSSNSGNGNSIRTSRPAVGNQVTRNSQSNSNSYSTVSLKMDGKMRSKPSVLGEVVKEIPMNSTVRILSNAEGDYLRISYQGREGYLNAMYVNRGSLQEVNNVTSSSNSSPSSFKWGTLKMDGKMRDKANAVGKIIKEIPHNAEVRILADLGDYLQISYQGTMGYINEMYLEVSSSENSKVHNNTITITGTVKDNFGDVLPGAYISVKGNTIGTQTDFDGNYKITVKKDDILIFQNSGKQKLEVEVSRASLNKIDVLLGMYTSRIID